MSEIRKCQIVIAADILDCKKKKVEDGKSMQSLSFQGWIGVLYNENCKRDSGENYGNKPSFELEISKGAITRPDGDGWDGNSWGWWCCSIDCTKEWSGVLGVARDNILSLVKKLNPLSEV